MFIILRTYYVQIYTHRGRLANDELFLPAALHREVAFALCVANLARSSSRGGSLANMARRWLPTGLAGRGGVGGSGQSFGEWCWERVRALSLFDAWGRPRVPLEVRAQYTCSNN